MSSQADYTFKLILAGDTQVGKTSFFQTLQDIRQSRIDTTTTIGVDLTVLHYSINNKQIKVQLWDTAGQERFQSIARTYFRNICGIILMFDVSKPETFYNLKKWIDIIEYENKCEHNHPIMILGNKSELINKINKAELDEFIDSHNINYKEISCKQGNIHLEELFVSFVSLILEEGSPDTCNGVQCDNTRLILNDRQTIANKQCCTIV